MVSIVLVNCTLQSAVSKHKAGTDFTTYSHILQN